MDRCPRDYPFPYDDGKRCCRHLFRNAIADPSPDCDGSRLRWESHAACCYMQEYVTCTDQHRGCKMAKGKTLLLIDTYFFLKKVDLFDFLQKSICVHTIAPTVQTQGLFMKIQAIMRPISPPARYCTPVNVKTKIHCPMLTINSLKIMPQTNKLL